MIHHMPPWLTCCDPATRGPATLKLSVGTFCTLGLYTPNKLLFAPNVCESIFTKQNGVLFLSVRVLQHGLMFSLAPCVIPNQPFVYDALPREVDLPVELMVTNSSSSCLGGSYFAVEERLYTVKLRHPP